MNLRLPLPLPLLLPQALLLAALLAGCSTAPYKTDYDYDPEVVFTSYRSWAWMSPNPMVRGAGSPANPLLEGRIMAEVEQAMASKGFRQVDDPEGADMAISFTVGARDKISVNSYPTTYRTSYGRWGSGWGPGYGYGVGVGTDVSVREYTEGQLAIDVFDVRARRPVYHGFATGNIRKNRSQQEREEILRNVVNDIMLTFPPS